MKILIIEDSQRMSDRIASRLKGSYTLEAVNTGHKGIAAVSDRRFDLIILDLGLPDMHGSTVCQTIRKNLQDVPILILTGEDEPLKKAELLRLGADDYLTKPFNEEELKARIESLLRRRSRLPASSSMIIDDLTIDIIRREVSRAGEKVKLRRKEFDILEYLAMHEGEIVRRENIMHHAWNADGNGWTGSVDVHIKHLRDKIDKPFSYPLIRTVYGVGYMLEGRKKDD